MWHFVEIGRFERLLHKDTCRIFVFSRRAWATLQTPVEVGTARAGSALRTASAALHGHLHRLRPGRSGGPSAEVLHLDQRSVRDESDVRGAEQVLDQDAEAARPNPEDHAATDDHMHPTQTQRPPLLSPLTAHPYPGAGNYRSFGNSRPRKEEEPGSVQHGRLFPNLRYYYYTVRPLYSGHVCPRS